MRRTHQEAAQIGYNLALIDNLIEALSERFESQSGDLDVTFFPRDTKLVRLALVRLYNEIEDGKVPMSSLNRPCIEIPPTEESV